jgi:hypothetical protein
VKSFLTDPPFGKRYTHLTGRVMAVSVLFLVLFVTEFSFCDTPPAYFAYEISPPAGVPALVNPSSIYYDRRHGEMYVADTGNDRVVIFDKRGNYLFEFADKQHLASPRSLVVDSSGHILALCERRSDRLEEFDYDGRFLREISLKPSATDTTVIMANSITIDDSDRVYALCADPGHIYVVGTDGTPVRDFPLFQDLSPSDRSQPIVGSISVVNGLLVIPIPVISALTMYKTTGEFVKLFGHAGGGPGLLSFPVATSTDGHGNILVMDKHRHTLLRYDADGTFIDELGGMGMNRGWFYHPISICTDDSGHCIVLQSFLSRVQAVNLPSVKKPAGEVRVTTAQGASAAPAAEDKQTK